MERIYLSDRWKVSRGWFLDLGDQGTAIMTGEGEIIERGDNYVAIGIEIEKYEYKNWVFSDMELIVYMDTNEKINNIDDALLRYWDYWRIDGTSKTKVISRGLPEDILNTILADIVIKIDEQKSNLRY